MKTLYLDCGMGAAGDMLAAALMELIPDSDAFIDEMNALGIPGVCVRKETSVKCGITGTHVSVIVNGTEEESADYHGHVHGGESEHVHSHGDKPGQEHVHSHVDESGQEHVHSHGDGAGQEHVHSHADESGQEYIHSHVDESGQEHVHSHGDEPMHGHVGSHEGESGHAHGGGPVQEHIHSHGDSHHGHAHHHSSLHDIEHIVRDHLVLPEKVKDDIMAVYGLIAEAESHAHGVPVTEIHFHEVGTLDAVADIAMVCMLMNRLSPEEVVVSPVHVGCGQVRCAHGILPVPAPATAYILRDIPVYGGQVRGELCTPTGAALLKHFATRFGDMPVMKISAIGYGMGKKDFEAANCVRAILGETEGKTDYVIELSCNVDDMTAEQIGFAMKCFFENGARDVYTVPIGMKKSRPGTLIRVICSEQDKEKMLALIFQHTTTIGVRENRMRRYVLDRKFKIVKTPYGVVHRKDSTGYGVRRSKYEYGDLAAIAREKGISLEEIMALVEDSDND